jgi:lipoate-protein ligase A
MAVGEAFESEYAKADDVYYVSEDNVSGSALERYHHYASWDWLYGKTPNFDVTFDEKFEWGELVLSFKLKDAIIEESGVYSDAMSTDLVDLLKTLFNGKRMERRVLGLAISEVDVPEHLKDQFKDISEWIKTLPI